MTTVTKEVPSNLTFAEEVKEDRLKALYRVTIGISGLIIIGLLSFGSISRDGINLLWVTSMALLLAGGFATERVLRQMEFRYAAWTFMLVSLVSISLLFFHDSALTQNILPFVFPIVIFIGGLLLSPVSTFVASLIAITTIIFIPAFSGNEFELSVTFYQMFGSLLILFSAALASQVTGELYQITQWALDNYKRERATNEELFEKRQQLQLNVKRAEALSNNLKDANEELEVAHREAEDAKNFRGQFLANMSHELRTPLNAIIGFSETMLQFPIMYDNEELPEAYQRDLNQIYSSGRQLLHVINDILDLAKVDAGKLEIHQQKVETEPIVNAVMSTAKGLLGSKPVKLEKDFPDEMPTVWADETRLRQVLLNLYSNACKYTDEGYIKLHVSIDSDAKMAQFDIEDTGLGIDPEFHDMLFQEFQQAKHGGRDPRSGSGLGLAISKQLLELMEGDIWMQSTVGEGSTFTFTVPLYDNQDADPTATQPKVITLHNKQPVEAESVE